MWNQQPWILVAGGQLPAASPPVVVLQAPVQPTPPQPMLTALCVPTQGGYGAPTAYASPPYRSWCWGGRRGRGRGEEPHDSSWYETTAVREAAAGPGAEEDPGAADDRRAGMRPAIGRDLPRIENMSQSSPPSQEGQKAGHQNTLVFQAVHVTRWKDSHRPTATTEAVPCHQRAASEIPMRECDGCLP
ncbi:hypothetical protein Q1695_005529 [Nippostrongylus brasiliensis]|nr:hypothetical protein Q1695_005529 [Nippostrongylus brasiliensis]